MIVEIQFIYSKIIGVQSIGFNPCFINISLLLEKCWQPKKPL